MGLKDEVGKFKEQIEVLRKAYEQYFIGNSRLPPNKLRDELDRFVRNHSIRKTASSADNFMLNSAIATYTTYRNYWDKILKMIDDGVLVREKAGKGFVKARNAEMLSEAKNAVLISKPDEKKFREVYELYINAKKRCGEDISKLSYEKVSSSIKHQIPTIKERFNCNSVEFRVTIEDGRAKLKAVPR